MTTPTSQKVINYLEHNQPASCTKIGNALNVSRANIHYHISQFIKQGLVKQIPQPSVTQPRGRPTQLYQLAKQTHPDTLTHLIDCLLNDITTQNKTQGEQQHALLRIARKMFPRLESETQSLPRYLNNIISKLNERGYKANWETHRDGPLITFRNCPYLSIIENHPVMCKIDTLIVQELLGSPYVIANSSLMSEDPKMSDYCRFFFRVR